MEMTQAFPTLCGLVDLLILNDLFAPCSCCDTERGGRLCLVATKTAESGEHDVMLNYAQQELG